MQLDSKTLDQLFREARTHNGWLDKPVSEEQIQQMYDLMKWAPTSANTSPARLVFVRSPKSKQRLLSALAAGNVEKTLAAPATVIVGHDLDFYEKLPKLFPHTDARSWFVGNEDFARITAFRNSSLQGAYLIMAARAIGLDTGAMSGFDNDKVDAEFFPGGRIKSNFLLNIGYGDHSALFDRSPRLDFAEAAEIV